MSGLTSAFSMEMGTGPRLNVSVVRTGMDARMDTMKTTNGTNAEPDMSIMHMTYGYDKTFTTTNTDSRTETRTTI